MNINDLLPASQTYGSSSHQQSMNELTLGGGGSSPPTTSPLRRSKSDSGRPSHHRQSRSEDITSSPMPHRHLPQTQTHLPPNYHPHEHGHRHSLSVTGSTSGKRCCSPLPQIFFLPCAVVVLVLMRTTPTSSKHTTRSHSHSLPFVHYNQAPRMRDTTALHPLVLDQSVCWTTPIEAEPLSEPEGFA